MPALETMESMQSNMHDDITKGKGAAVGQGLQR